MLRLTQRQSAALSSARERWTSWIYSTRSADREQAEEGVRLTYRAAGVPTPEILLWCDDLMEAMLAAEQLSGYHESNWALPEPALHLREEAQRRIEGRLGLPTWAEVIRAVGPLHTPLRHEKRLHKGVWMMVGVRRRDSLQAGLPTAADDDPIDCQEVEQAAEEVGTAAFAAEHEMRDIVGGAAGPGVPGHPGIGFAPSIYYDYRWSLLFRHDCLLGIWGEQESAVYNGLRLTAEHCGPWWGFGNAALLCDRPATAQRDEHHRLHNPNGPAVVFRNGVVLFAWHGSWVPERAIRDPQSLTHSEIRAETSNSTRAALIEIYGADRYERERKPAPPPRKRSPLDIGLPREAPEKIEKLRSYGPLPLYERYVAGDYRKVWGELLSLGGQVREDRYAADALAVAYSLMDRVRSNVARVIGQLRGMGYRFDADSDAPANVVGFNEARLRLLTGTHPERGPWTQPLAGAWNLRRLEIDAGQMPIALRAWYEVVGAVTLAGTHPVLSAGDAGVESEPLVVAPFSQILRAWDQSSPEVGAEGRAFVAEVAFAGKHPLRITFPSPRMDAVLENCRRRLLFVDYLRLAFEYGGFPGFERVRKRPKEIARLTEGLLSF